jgi:hypothetical protein
LLSGLIAEEEEIPSSRQSYRPAILDFEQSDALRDRISALMKSIGFGI